MESIACSLVHIQQINLYSYVIAYMSSHSYIKNCLHYSLLYAILSIVNKINIKGACYYGICNNDRQIYVRMGNGER